MEDRRSEAPLRESGKVRESGKEARKRALLASARRLIETEGLSMRRLALEAGVSHATPYNLFRSKQHLLLELYAEHLHRLNLALMVNPNPDPILRIFDAIDCVADEINAYPAFYRELFGVIYSTERMTDAKFWWVDPAIEFWRGLFEAARVAGCLRGEIDIDALAGNYFRLLLGSAVEWLGGKITADELRHSAHSGFALWALAIAAPDAAPVLRARFQHSQAIQGQFRERRPAPGPGTENEPKSA
jgi:AcrR family transcriptional regulator